MSRRSALSGLGLLAVGACGASPQATGGASAAPGPMPARRFGAEWESHVRTVMAWPASAGIWADLLPEVRADIARLARAIGEYEEVVMLARPAQVAAARAACGGGVLVVPIPVDDLWTRDTVPVFVEEAGEVHGVDFNFNGWGRKQTHDHDAAVAEAVLDRFDIPGIDTWLVAEGGSFETDGKGTLMATESSLVNDNRNPGRSRADIEAELRRVLGLRKVIWFEGVRGQDITDAHVDYLARFTPSGAVLLDRAAPGTPPDVWTRVADQAHATLTESTDADGRPVEVIEVFQPDDVDLGPDAVISYLNFSVTNDAVFLPEFGDREADDRAAQLLRDHFPDRDIIGIRIDAIASGGGGIHCATHDQPGEPAN
ncbi:agmatine deiminase family protein [Actinokineospora guangxiensis]|uniref:Agmatine deiminase family protein n=1 Tax=Actinokineospora guangxiensis TaxID=1490288 RepID=A0ABW0EQS5_9PSEU